MVNIEKRRDGEMRRKEKNLIHYLKTLYKSKSVLRCENINTYIHTVSEKEIRIQKIDSTFQIYLKRERESAITSHSFYAYTCLYVHTLINHCFNFFQGPSIINGGFKELFLPGELPIHIHRTRRCDES